MRLLSVKELKFTDFTNCTNRPKYAIASHRWTADEVTYKDVQEGRNKERAGYRKVKDFAAYIKEQLPWIEWLWIDTCCINKESDAELSYAINSMFAWYRDAEICIAYLSDVEEARRHENSFEKSDWLKSKWFTRGWTLQELLAPRTVIFVTAEWQVIGNKGASFHSYDAMTTGTDLFEDIAIATDLPKHVLNDWAKAVNIGVNEKIKWMDGRATTRPEDMWYALFGIIGVSLSTIYGEGHDRAKERLIGAVRLRDEVAAQHSDQYQKVKNWLSASDPWTNHYSARKLHEPNTGSWLLTSTEYQAWKTGLTKHLWIHGKAGCGKTVLCSTAIEDMQTYCKDKSDVVQAIFYFSFSDTQKQSFEDLIRSIVSQLGWREPGYSMLYQIYDRPDRKALGQEELRRILCNSLSAYTDVFVHIDALDECSESNGLQQDVLHQITKLLQQATNMRMIATTRDIPDVRQFMEGLSAAQIPIGGDTIQPDILQYISTQLSLSKRLSQLDARSKATIEETLARKADGMFRWVYCQLQELNKSKRTNPSAIRAALDALPATLDETYERMLTAIDSTDYTVAFKLLRWLSYAQRPLSLNELAEACIVYPPDNSSGRVDVDDRGSFHDALSLLGGLVVTMEDQYSSDTEELISDTEEFSSDREEFSSDKHMDQIKPETKIRLAHFSVQEYLESSRILTHHAQGFHLDPLREHRFVTHCCLVYLINYSSYPQKTLSEADLRPFPLLEYAARFWWQHALLEQSDDVLYEVHFLETDGYRRDWLQICTPEDDLRRRLFISYESKTGTALYCASLLGLERVAEEMLKDKANVNAEGGQYGNALQAASYRGHEKVVQMLLEAKADVNAEGGHFGNALQAASSQGHEKVVQMLLEAKANVNAEGGHFGNALQAASSGGHQKVMQMLLEAEANVNAKGGHFGNALQAASSGGHEKVVQMLLEAKADVNAEGGHFGNALQAASFGGSEKVVQMLLEAKADFNAKGGHFGNALQAASSGGHEKVVQMLLEAEADVNAEGGLYGNALHAASYNGLEKVVQMLLEAEANVNAEGGFYGNALQAASFGGSEKVVQMLLEAAANVNAEGGEYGNALQAASSEGHEKVVQMLLEAAANVNAEGGEYGNALQAASFGGHEKVVQMLLEAEANVNAEGGEYGNALQAASSEGHEKVVQMLLEAEANVNAEGGHFGSALQAASFGGSEKVVQMLLEAKADVNAEGGLYGNALHAASYKGLEKVVQMLLEAEANVNAEGGLYGNALQAASSQGHEKVVRMLLEAKADVNAVGGRYGNALHAATTSGHEKVLHILEENGAELTLRWVDELGRTLLHLAETKHGINTLLAYDLDIDALDKHGWTPLHWAAYFGRSEVVLCLVQKGANPKLQDWRGQDPYQVAQWSGQSSTILSLLRESDDGSSAIQPAERLRGDCNHCGHDLVEFQYHCDICPQSPGYDLCVRCAQDRSTIHPNHTFREDFRYGV